MVAIESFAELGRVFREAKIASFAAKTKSKGVAVDNSDLIQQMKEDLESRLSKRLTRVYDVTELDGVFEGKAEQRISIGRSQFYEFKIDPDEGVFTYRMTNADEALSFADSDEGFNDFLEFTISADFAGKGSRAGKKLNCKPGNMQCGGKCQGGSRACPSQMSEDERKAYKAAQRKGGSKPQSTKAERFDVTKNGEPPTKDELTAEADNFLQSYSSRQAREDEVGGPRDRVEEMNRVIKSDRWAEMSADERVELFTIMENATPSLINNNSSNPSRIGQLATLQQQLLYRSMSDSDKEAFALAVENNPRFVSNLTDSRNPRMRAIGDDIEQRLEVRREAERQRRRARRSPSPSPSPTRRPQDDDDDDDLSSLF